MDVIFKKKKKKACNESRREAKNKFFFLYARLIIADIRKGRGEKNERSSDNVGI